MAAVKQESRNGGEVFTKPEDSGNNGVNILEGNQVSYIGFDIDSIPEFIIKKYGSSAKRLDLSFNCLRTLEGIDKFLNLQELVLDNNNLDDTLVFPHLPHLHILTVNKNKITDIDAFVDKVRENLPSLEYLSLLGNIACPNELSAPDKDEEDYQRYRYFVLYRLPNLKFLDSNPVSYNERCEAKRVGSYMKIVKPPEEMFDGEESQSPPTSPYTPLPQSVKEGGQHKGTFGQCRYMYYGRHSEGNRFIRNNDL
ncbi:leucine-rich melanocyte differentiation-associated protein-like [Saccoglossus kowalevskii]|uniref:Leucine-rich repeat-containing protein C10orf11 homolog n=1 Tax=Saccoglossus kowalevskii TaxID=10224 RepID=A0ABM0MDL3_SACKO|nr:PREDICTED: leucine-rich repeat-containing protein C10orf11 homolog [Saccoglossus kowalevskii]